MKTQWFVLVRSQSQMINSYSPYELAATCATKKEAEDIVNGYDNRIGYGGEYLSQVDTYYMVIEGVNLPFEEEVEVTTRTITDTKVKSRKLKV